MSVYRRRPSPPELLYHQARNRRWMHAGSWLALAIWAASLSLLASRGQQTSLAVLIGFFSLYLIPLLVFWFFRYDGGRAVRAQAGVRAERAAHYACKRLPKGHVAFANLVPNGWTEDIDLIILGPRKLVVVEVKSDPGQIVLEGEALTSRRRHHSKDLSRTLVRTRMTAASFRRYLIDHAKAGNLPVGIPAPHALTVFHPMKPSRTAYPAGSGLVQDLPSLVANLTDNVENDLYEPLRSFLMKEVHE